MSCFKKVWAVILRKLVGYCRRRDHVVRHASGDDLRRGREDAERLRSIPPRSSGTSNGGCYTNRPQLTTEAKILRNVSILTEINWEICGILKLVVMNSSNEAACRFILR